MSEENGSLDTLIENKLSEDNDFQESLKDLSDEDKESKTNERKSELLQQEAKSLWEKANKATKAEELANNYKIRAEKAEQELKKFNKPADGETTPKKQDDNLSSKDLYALMEAKVPHDDVDYLVKQSKALEKDIPSLLKEDEIKIVLKTRAEKRTTAEATNTGKSRAGSKEPSESEILERVNTKGEIPEKGSKEAEKLFWAKRGGKKD